MPELPEVEVLVRHLRPLIEHKKILSVEVRRERVLRPTTSRRFKQALKGATFGHVTRRGKYLLFEISKPGQQKSRLLVGHLGMTGRMYLLRPNQELPTHAAVILNFSGERFIFEDTRYFGRLTLDTKAIEKLGPEPLREEFTPQVLACCLARSSRAIKVKLLDQSLVAGVGNIYASEALFRAGISPKMPARKLNRKLVKKLWMAVRETLLAAIEFGSTVPLDYAGTGEGGGLFYYGRAPESARTYEERLCVYDRAGLPCLRCGTNIKRIVQAARSTFYCPTCQRGKSV